MNLSVTPLSAGEEVIGRALWLLEDTRRRTLDVLKNSAPEAIDRMPAHGTGTIGSLLYHVAAIELSWLYDEVLVAPYPVWAETFFPVDVRDDDGKLSLLAGQSLAEHLERLAKVREDVVNVYANMALDDYRRLRHLPQYAVTPEWVLHHLMQHEAEHRGQIAGLL